MLKQTGRTLLAVAAMALASTAAQADWPTDKPIKMIVPFPAGGGTDFAGRLVAQHLSTHLEATDYGW